MKVTLNTSGSTSISKKIFHNNIEKYIDASINETKLTSNDIVLDVFPSNVIAHYTITSQPALAVGAHLISTNFDPYSYIQLFEEYRPTFISLIPRHIEILSKLKSWKTLDMSCVRYMVTGSQKVTQPLINSLINNGVQLVANWYGMTEFPPPVFIGYNTTSFDFTNTMYDIQFSNDGECIIDGYYTKDIFDLSTKTFIRRKNEEINTTWKTNPVK